MEFINQEEAQNNLLLVNHTPLKRNLLYENKNLIKKKQLDIPGNGDEKGITSSRWLIIFFKIKLHNKLTIAIRPEIIINKPVILLTHRSPFKSNFFLKSVTPELRERNHKDEPIKTPATRADAEK